MVAVRSIITLPPPGLQNLQAGYKPAAWLVLDGTLPAAELNQLKAVAPVLTTLAAAKSFANAPLAYSAGLTGIGVLDQLGRLIVTATNQGSGNVSGKVTLKTLAAGAYVATDLFTNAAVRFTVASGSGALSVTVTRWDTRAFAIVRAG